MPAVEFERPLRIAPLESAAFKKGPAQLPPRPRTSDVAAPPASAPSTASAGISIMKPVKSASSGYRRRLSYDLVTDPFEAHLEDIYAGRATSDDGLRFFESHGYYDVSDANTVAMFRQNFGMKKQFWDGADHDIVFYEEMNLDTVDLAGLQVLNAGAMLSKNVKRHRTTSGRFELLDDEGNVVDPETHLEHEREKRRKLRHLELDDDDRATLAQEQRTLAVAITVIRTEQTRFKRYFYEACKEEMNITTPTVVLPQEPAPTLTIQLPSFSGYLYVLKDSIPHLFRSWHKRWVFLDVEKGIAHMYKRSYWKSERGSLDLRSVINITRMNQSDICLQCFDGRSLLFRSKAASSEVDMWVNLLQLSRRQVGGAIASPALPQLPASTTPASMTQLTTTTTTKTITTVSTPNAFLVSTKIGAPDEKSVLDMLLQAKIMSNNTITAA